MGCHGCAAKADRVADDAGGAVNGFLALPFARYGAGSRPGNPEHNRRGRDCGRSDVESVQPHRLKAAQYVQLRLQQEVFGSHQIVVANRNSSEYVGRNAPSTSYVVSVFENPDAAALGQFSYADQQITFFGGDVFLGRWFNQPLTQERTRTALVEKKVRGLTGGEPDFVINLEGAIALLPTVGRRPNGTSWRKSSRFPCCRR